MKSNHTKFLRLKTYLIFSLLSLIFIQASAIKRIEANPINIAYMLAQDTDSASIAKILAYYGYQPSEVSTSLKTEDSRLKTEYIHPNGSIIRYSFKEASKAQPYPYVEIKSKSGSRNINAILTNLGFQKQGNIYEAKANKYSRFKFTCHPSSNGILIFQKKRAPQSSK